MDRLAVFGREKIRLIAESGKKGSDAVEAMPVSFLVMGEVNCPGEFNLPAPVTLLDAVAAAGGPSVDGSLRKVRVDRSGKPALEADLYDFFVDERPVSDFYLAEGDVITFQAGGSLVKFSGQVSRAGIFEMLPGEMTLEKALLLTGSFSGPFSACKVEILRNIGGYKRAFFTIQLAESEKAPAMPLLDGDEIRVSECRLVPEKIVLTGH
ncbi:MAG TPA: SLBB domain-containing protein, partial [Candidatus Rifleibacterium sp.]|nr:SLBB domain-containing protein [Candidatus Rifleibacterium sp.]